MRLLGILGAKPAKPTVIENKFGPLASDDDDQASTSIQVPFAEFIRPQTSRQRRRIKEHMRMKAKMNLACSHGCKCEERNPMPRASCDTGIEEAAVMRASCDTILSAEDFPALKANPVPRASCDTGTEGEAVVRTTQIRSRMMNDAQLKTSKGEEKQVLFLVVRFHRTMLLQPSGVSQTLALILILTFPLPSGVSRTLVKGLVVTQVK